MEEKLIKIWKIYSVNRMISNFANYAEKNGFIKWDCRRKDNTKTYYCDKKSTNGNRATCQLRVSNSPIYAHPNIEIVLRKESGNYFIIAFNGVRAFEVDYRRGVISFNKKLLNEHLNELENIFCTALTD